MNGAFDHYIFKGPRDPAMRAQAAALLAAFYSGSKSASALGTVPAASRQASPALRFYDHRELSGCAVRYDQQIRRVDSAGQTFYIAFSPGCFCEVANDCTLQLGHDDAEILAYDEDLVLREDEDRQGAMLSFHAKRVVRSEAFDEILAIYGRGMTLTNYGCSVATYTYESHWERRYERDVKIIDRCKLLHIALTQDPGCGQTYVNIW